MRLVPPAPSTSSPLLPLLARRALLPLPLLLLPHKTPAADTFDFVENGKVKQLTEIEARDALTRKVEKATAAGKGLDAERRGGLKRKRPTQPRKLTAISPHAGCPSSPASGSRSRRGPTGTRGRTGTPQRGTRP